MGPVERFTRDAASRYVWAVVALAAAIGLTYAFSSGDRAVERARAVSEERALRYVEDVLGPRVGGRDISAPITGQSADSLEAVVRRSILADERVARVRIWSNDGTLLFSTDRSDDPGSNEGLNDPLLREASREGALTRSDFSDGGGADDPERAMLRTYAPLGSTAVAEIDQTGEGTIEPVRTEWVGYQLLAGGLLLLSLVLLALSLRDPIERINVGVPFAASSVPRGFSLIDDDRLAAVEEVYRLASERVDRLQAKLEESEEARRRLEGDIQRALSKVATGAPRPVAPAASAPPPRAPEPAVVQVPESEVVETSALGEAWAAAPAGPLARASRPQKPAPTTSLREKPAAEKRKRSPKRLRAKPVKPTAAPPEVATPTPAPAPASEPEPERRVTPVAATAAPAPAAPAPAPAPAVPRPAAAPPAPAPARAPSRRQAPPPAPADAELEDAKAHAAALETFIRLTESDRQHHETSPADQSEMRAALARTAARKKPGGERLHPHEDPPGESLGGPPNGRR